MGTGFLMLPMKIRLFDIASEVWAFDIANENYVLMLSMKIGLYMMPTRTGL